MQIKNQNGRTKERWAAAAVGTLGALGIGGLAVAGPGLWTYTPEPINLQDQVELATVTESTVGVGFTYPAVRFGMSADATWDSPYNMSVPNPISMSPDLLESDSISLSPDSLESDSISMSPESLESDSISISPDSLESDSISMSPESLESDSISMSPESLESDSISMSSGSLDSP